jgi:sugar/nucleoside kinase (ribokinase family)
MDCEEAVRISGKPSSDDATHYFINSGVSTFIITNGPKDIIAFSNGDLFSQCDLIRLPVSERVKSELNAGNVRSGDTTGCGDNFAGGMIASIGKQIRIKTRGELNFSEALAWGAASGGQSCFYKGGTYIERSPGEKYNLVKSYYQDYLIQISGR